MPNPFKQWSESDLSELVQNYPLALLVHDSGNRQNVLPLPMLADLDENGRLVRLVGHMALRNPMVELLKGHPQTLFVFQGPHGYVSPTIVHKPFWGPTWNYAIAWVQATVAFRPENNHAALKRLVSRMEGDGPGSWSHRDLGERFERLASRIIAFDAEVSSVNATFKLGQDESEDVFSDILEGLDNPPLEHWMLKFRRDRA